MEKWMHLDWRGKGTCATSLLVQIQRRPLRFSGIRSPSSTKARAVDGSMSEYRGPVGSYATCVQALSSSSMKTKASGFPSSAMARTRYPGPPLAYWPSSPARLKEAVAWAIEKWRSSTPSVFASCWAKVVLPTPGGPSKSKGGRCTGAAGARRASAAARRTQSTASSKFGKLWRSARSLSSQGGSAHAQCGDQFRKSCSTERLFCDPSLRLFSQSAMYLSRSSGLYICIERRSGTSVRPLAIFFSALPTKLSMWERSCWRSAQGLAYWRMFTSCGAVC